MKPIADRVDHTEERRRGATKPVWDRGETKDTCRDKSGGLSGGRNHGDTTKTTMVHNFDFEPMIDKTAARQYRDTADIDFETEPMLDVDKRKTGGKVFGDKVQDVDGELSLRECLDESLHVRFDSVHR